MPTPCRTIPVTLASASYDVLVGDDLLPALGEHVRRRLGGINTALLVIDANLPESTIAAARNSLRLAGLHICECVVTATELLKSLGTLERIVRDATAARLERGEPIIALGGGIVGDLAGFAAAVYRRGVPIVQCPTTLLSMVDASVGGKTGANLLPDSAVSGSISLKKNLIGAFHQPSLVLCDVGTLHSLPPREFRSGLAECIKHALLAPDWGDPDLLDWTRTHLSAILIADAAVRADLVARNVAIKARVVQADEREERDDNRGRMVLNMGHTVGHAIEPLACQPVPQVGSTPSDTGLLHGEAVGLGLIAETVCAEHAGVSIAGTSTHIAQLLADAGLPTRAANLPPTDVILDATKDDKKVKRGSVRLAVVTHTGHGMTRAACEICDVSSSEWLSAGIEAIRA